MSQSKQSIRPRRIPALALLAALELLGARAALARDPTPPSELPPPKSSHQPRPPVPGVSSGHEGAMITEQAGVGGTQSYARRGVLELGGFVAYNSATEFQQLTIRPTAGWFFMDNWELSALPGLTWSKIGGASRTTVSFLAEPSFHMPFNDATFGFAGLGLGVASNGGTGMAVAPRIGANFMVGRSGILTPSLGVTWSTGDAVRTSEGVLLAVRTAWTLGAGYTVMW